MQESARVVLFDIKELGYYKRGDPVSQFGTLGNILLQLQVWAKDKSYTETKTYDVDKGNLLPSYYVNSVSRGNNHLLTLWNESPTTDGAVASLNGNDLVGGADVTLNQLGDGEIPGQATYFFFMEDVNAVATVRFQHAASGKAQLSKYIYSFMQSFSAHAVKEVDQADGSIRTSGFRASRNDPITKYRPRFKLEIRRRASERQYLIDNAVKVRKVHKKANLELSKRDQLALWQRVLKATHLHEPSQRPHLVKLDYSMDVEGLDPIEVKKIIDAWDDEDDQNDYGFKFVGDSELHWLGKAIAKDEFALNIERLNAEIVKPESLFTELVRHRSSILRLMN